MVDPDAAAKWAAKMRAMPLVAHICWETDGVSACLMDREHEGPHGWEAES